MRYGTVCSGIEAASVAFAPLGWEPVFFAEIEPFCRALLAYHYPAVPNLGDFTQIGKETPSGAIDLLIAGTPCQSFSVAGQRGGLADPRGNLTLEYFDLLDRLRPRWMVWENVPGLLSDNGGRTFGTCLGLLGKCGYGFAYRVLDAEHWGVPQRRYRVFTVGYLGDWRPPAAVLFERHSLSGHPAPGRETREDVAACLTQGVDSQGKGGYAGRRREDDLNLVGFRVSSNCGAWETGDRTDSLVTQTDRTAFILAQNGSDIQVNSLPGAVHAGQHRQTSGDLVVFDTTQITSPDNRCQPQAGDPCHPLTGSGHAPAVFSESGTGWWREGVAPLPQRSDKDGTDGLVVAMTFTERTRTDGRNLETLTDTAYALCNPGSGERAQSRQVLAPCLTQNYGKNPDNSDTGEGPMLVQNGMMVRRLTPLECERLMGLPDTYTLIPYRGKPAKDAPRYRAIGNSFAVPVVRWIGTRIQRVEDVIHSKQTQH